MTSLRRPPQVANETVGVDIVNRFEELDLAPTLLFIDPFGYTGLSLRLINSVLRNWGCECIFFFNFNRINMGIDNPPVRPHMEALFGIERLAALQASVQGMSPAAREALVLDEMCGALRDMGGQYVLPFCFKRDDGVRTSHHLIFVSKHPLGYGIMKEVMAKASSSSAQGVPSYTYSPVAPPAISQLSLFPAPGPLDALQSMLLADFAGQRLTMKQIYEQHNLNRPYTLRNYKDALLRLEAVGKITASPAKRQKNTFGDSVLATFPD
ncbi:MAG TPA: three-Cys-motif partner protein TcmP [Thermomicrobiales bacterium]|nr:three-Cys-motif partner protein TcmP [Thermomicrobiales bacterium]